MCTSIGVRTRVTTFRAREAFTGATLLARQLMVESEVGVRRFLEELRGMYWVPRGILRDLSRKLRDAGVETIPGVPRREDHRHALDDVTPKVQVNYEPLKEALIERKVRKGMEREGLQRIPLYPEGRPCPAPTTDKVLGVCADIEEDRLTKAREVGRVFGPELTAQPTRDAEARRDARRGLHALSVRPVNAP